MISWRGCAARATCPPRGVPGFAWDAACGTAVTRPRYLTPPGSWRCGRAGHPPALPELCERQDVSVGIGEPRHLLAPRGRPDPDLVLVHALVADEHDALRGEATDGGRDVGDPPAENGVAGARGVGDRRHPEHGAVRVKDAREVVLLLQRQAQRLFVEHPRPVQVGGWREGDDVA